jgi:arylsulfatase
MALKRYVNRRIAAYNSWVADPAVRIIAELEASFKKHPPIKLGTHMPTDPVSP